LPYTYQVTPYYEMWVATGAGGAGIQFAYSGDGVNWHEFNGGAALPGLYSSGYHSFVLYDAGGFGTSYRYKVWYWSGIMGYSVGDIRTADSVDGIVWENDQALTQDGAMPIVTGLGVGWNRGSYGPNHVIYNAGGSATLDDGSLWNNRYVMYYNGTDGSQEYVGLGYSTDGKHWKRYGDDPILPLGASGEWDSYSISYVSLVRKNATEWHLWYSGSQTNGTNEGIGYASSSDGIHWTKSAGHIFHKSDGVAWRNDRTYTPVTLYSAANFDGHGDTSPYKMWFTGRSSGGNYAIGCARTDEVTFGSLLRPGDALTYTLTYVNNGPGPATSVTVMDRLSPGIKRTGSTSSPDHEPPTGADPVWVWSIGTLDAGQGGVITLSAVVDMNVAWGQLTTITNWVTITTATVEDNTANNVYSATQRVIPGEPYTVTLTPVPATIALTGTSSVTATVTDRWGNPVSDGTTITFTANSLGTIPTSQPRVTVNGVATSTFQAGLVAGAAIVTGTTTTAVGAASITVTPDLPYTLTLQANPTMLMANGASTSAITATVVDQFGNPVADNTSVSFSATLGSVSTPHLTKDGRAVATFTAGALAGTATVTATTNGRSSSVNLVLTQGLIDLSQSFKRASAAVVASTESLTYTIILTNSGNSVATNVVLTDPIPLGVTFVPSSLSGDGATYNASQNRIEWSGTLQPGGSVRFTYAITVSTVQVITVTNKANVSLDNVLDRVLIAEARVTPRYLYLPLVMRSFP